MEFTYQQTLRDFRGGTSKKNTLYLNLAFSGLQSKYTSFIFLATTLDTSVHNLSYSAAATTTRVILGIESALIPDRTSFCAFADSRLRVFLPVTTYVVVEKPDSTKGVGSH